MSQLATMWLEIHLASVYELHAREKKLFPQLKNEYITSSESKRDVKKKKEKKNSFCYDVDTDDVNSFLFQIKASSTRGIAVDSSPFSATRWKSASRDFSLTIEIDSTIPVDVYLLDHVLDCNRQTKIHTCVWIIASSILRKWINKWMRRAISNYLTVSILTIFFPRKFYSAESECKNFSHIFPK